jgi:hypothetical protein
VIHFRHDDSELFFKPLGHQSPMAPHIERLPTENDCIGAEVLGNLLCVERLRSQRGGASGMYRLTCGLNLGMPWLIATASGWFPLLAKLEVVIILSPYLRPH